MDERAELERQYTWARLGDRPRKGWSLVSVDDLGAPEHVCEACGYPEVRYVHHLKHPDGYDLAVGCVCSEHLTNDYIGPRATEKLLRNRYQRLQRVLITQRWKTTRNGNLRITYQGRLLVLYRSRFEDGWRINVDNIIGRRTHATEADAIKAAFDYIDPPRVRRADYTEIDDG